MPNDTNREVQATSRNTDWLCKMWYQMGKNAEKLDQISRMLEADRIKQEQEQ